MSIEQDISSKENMGSDIDTETGNFKNKKSLENQQNDPNETPDNHAIFQEDEQKELQKVNDLLNEQELSEEGIKELEEWLEHHSEFGLEKMSDSEYYSFFSDGGFYSHFTAFYDSKRKNAPIFLEAIKDGYLISYNVGNKRGEKIQSTASIAEEHGAMGESVIYFDNEKTQRNFLNKNRTAFSQHYYYAIKGPMEDCPPVALIAPGKLLEAHSVKNPQSVDNRKLGIGSDGVNFGSAKEDIFDTDHEIDLNLFVLLLPEMKVSRNFVNIMINNLSQDKRFIDAIDSFNETIETSEEYIELRPFMERLMTFLDSQHIHIPRLYFYQPEGKTMEKGSPGINSKVIFEGINDFLNTKNIPQVEKETSKSSIPEKWENIPEGYRIGQQILETTANTIRKKLADLGREKKVASLPEINRDTEPEQHFF